MRNTLKMIVAGTLLTAGSPVLAAPIIYNVSQSVGVGSVKGTITTDGTTGMLTTANVTAFSLLLNDGAGTFTLTNQNGGYAFGGNALSATTSGLFFNFDATGTNYALFQAPTTGSSIDYFCLQTSGCYVPITTPGEGLRIQGASLNNVLSGNYQFASTGMIPAVPEPASWAMMILGVGAVGFAMRRRQDVRTVVSYA